MTARAAWPASRSPSRWWWRPLDQAGRPVTGARIAFRFINTDGEVAPGTAETGNDGGSDGGKGKGKGGGNHGD